MRQFASGPVAHVVGILGGSAALGGLLAVAGNAVGDLRVIQACLLASAAMLTVGPIVRWRRPPLSSRWMFPRQWMRWGRVRYSFAFGFALGLGFLTIVSSGTYYLFCLGVATYAEAAEAVGLCLLFGASRGTPILLASRCLADRMERPFDCLQIIQRKQVQIDVVGRVIASALAGAVLLEVALPR